MHIFLIYIILLDLIFLLSLFRQGHWNTKRGPVYLHNAHEDQVKVQVQTQQSGSKGTVLHYALLLIHKQRHRGISVPSFREQDILICVIQREVQLSLPEIQDRRITWLFADCESGSVPDPALFPVSSHVTLTHLTMRKKTKNTNPTAFPLDSLCSLPSSAAIVGGQKDFSLM